jgi:AAA family ATP:ADP antiporter
MAIRDSITDQLLKITRIGKVDETVLIMQRLIFVLICTLLILKPTANAIFLSNLGVETLPVAYLALAFLALIVTAVYSRYVHTISTKKLFIYSTSISIVILILIGIMLLNSWFKTATVFFFYLFISIFGILSASQFWIIANQVFNAGHSVNKS